MVKSRVSLVVAFTLICACLAVGAFWLIQEWRIKDYSQYERAALPELNALNTAAANSLPVYTGVVEIERSVEGASWATGRFGEAWPIIYGPYLRILYGVDASMEAADALQRLKSDLMSAGWSDLSTEEDRLPYLILMNDATCLVGMPFDLPPKDRFVITIFQDMRVSPNAPIPPEPVEYYSRLRLMTSVVLSCIDRGLPPG